MKTNNAQEEYERIIIELAYATGAQADKVNSPEAHEAASEAHFEAYKYLKQFHSRRCVFSMMLARGHKREAKSHKETAEIMRVKEKV